MIVRYKRYQELKNAPKKPTKVVLGILFENELVSIKLKKRRAHSTNKRRSRSEHPYKDELNIFPQGSGKWKYMALSIAKAPRLIQVLKDTNPEDEVTPQYKNGVLLHRLIAALKGFNSNIISLLRYRDKDNLCLHVHHIDRNRYNNEASNLVVLTKRVHDALHRSLDGRLSTEEEETEDETPYLEFYFEYYSIEIVYKSLKNVYLAKRKELTRKRTLLRRQEDRQREIIKNLKNTDRMRLEAKLRNCGCKGKKPTNLAEIAVFIKFERNGTLITTELINDFLEKFFGADELGNHRYTQRHLRNYLKELVEREVLINPGGRTYFDSWSPYLLNDQW